ncbi:MAG: polyhydroxyalkanoate synthesis repressor PhaR [Nitratireductor sp.]
MADSKQPTVIKKYANRRLYNTGSSTYVTLEDLAVMVKAGDEFVVQDAKSGEDITRSVLAQIIFDQEGKEGQNLLPISFLRQLIRFYGDQMGVMIPSYLEHSMNTLAQEQEKLREQMSKAFGGLGQMGNMPINPMGMPGMSAMPGMEEQVRRNMEMFQKAMGMFMPFGQPSQGADPEADSNAGKSAGKPAASDKELKDLKDQLGELQKKLDKLG